MSRVASLAWCAVWTEELHRHLWCIVGAQTPGSGPSNHKAHTNVITEIQKSNIALPPYPEAINTNICFFITSKKSSDKIYLLASKAESKETFHWELQRETIEKTINLSTRVNLCYIHFFSGKFLFVCLFFNWNVYLDNMVNVSYRNL